MVPAYDTLRKRLAKKIHNQLLTSCVLFPNRREDEYLYVGDAFRKAATWLIFWRKAKPLSTQEKLIGTLFK